MTPSLLDRMMGRILGPPEKIPTIVEPNRLNVEPKRLIVPGTAVAVVEQKASSLARLPRGAYGPAYTFFSPDGGKTMIDFSDGQIAIALVAYWYVATRWRAEKIAEAPLMVVEEDQTTGDLEWLPDHELVPLLEAPSEDYDMGELITQTSYYLDNTGSAIWVKDRTGINQVGRLSAFSRAEFEVKRSKTRLFDRFIIQTDDGPDVRMAEDVCFFKDSQLSSRGWSDGKSRLDIAMSWLRLSERSRQTIHALLANSVWPSIVVSPSADWDPDEELFKEYVQEVEKYGKDGNKGRPFIALGGAKIDKLSASIGDLVPTDVLNRVESVVAAISGVPAIVLQYQVGLENSPWSQMSQARRMAYDDTIAPMWRKMERVLDRQLLREVDDDSTHHMRFDTTNVESLKRDQLESTTIAVSMGRAATLNERRGIMGLEPATKEQDPDGKANDIPELSTPSIMDLLGGDPTKKPPFGKDPEDDGEDTEKDPEEDPASEDEEAPADKPKKKTHAQLLLVRKFRASALLVAMRDEAIPLWQLKTLALLHEDANAIADIVRAYITNTSEKSLETKARQKDRAMSAVARYLNEESKSRWTKTIGPLTTQAAQRGGAVVAADLNISFGLLHSNILSFAKQTAAKTVGGISKTTQSLVSDIIQGGIDANATNEQIATLIRDATGFSKSRARLIARTETTKLFNGAPEQSLAALSRSTGVRYTKTWSGALDDIERDEHVAMEGETVDVGDAFSNGLDFPSEPNCRCTVLFAEAEDE